jgi:osmoprotectant transport system ATP-binding protein
LQELLEITKISEQWLNRYPKEISGGQQQRVGIARALYHDPEFLLLDEPLGALDPILRKDLQQSLLELFRQLKKTVILVTHDLNEAEYLGDAIAVMNKGHIEQVGTGEQLRLAPQTDFVKKFVEVF